MIMGQKIGCVGYGSSGDGLSAFVMLIVYF